MCQIRPLPAVRYNTADQRDLSARLAPPYDVLSETDKQALLAKDPANFVKIDLPHTPPKTAGPPEVYDQARRQLDAWIAAGVMVRDDAPAIYAYHQHFEYGGARYVRKMFFARLRLEQFGSGQVFPHEQTFGGPKEDRLCLTKACAANLSPIFGLFPDADNAVAAVLDGALASEPLATGTLDGLDNRLWAVTDSQAIEQVAGLLADRPVFIADGHHRYGTGLLYQEYCQQQRGPLADDDPANFVLCVFCAMEDPGLLILPTHRVLTGVNVPATALADDANIECQPLSVAGPSEAIAAVADLGPQAFVCYSAAAQSYLALRPTRPELLDDLAPERALSWRRLGLAFLHAYVLDRVIAPTCCNDAAPDIRYVKADQAAVDQANETGGTAMLMQATTMEELRAVCQAGELMPQKSTFFYPKLASGLIINPLDR